MSLQAHLRWDGKSASHGFANTAHGFEELEDWTTGLGVPQFHACLAHGLRNETIARDKKAQEQTSSCLRATFIMLSPGYKTVLRAKLAHIVLKAGQGFNA